MEKLETYFGERLDLLETGANVVRGNTQETQMILLEVHNLLFSLRTEVGETRKEVNCMKGQMEAVKKLDRLLSGSRARVSRCEENIPPQLVAGKSAKSPVPARPQDKGTVPARPPQDKDEVGASKKGGGGGGVGQEEEADPPGGGGSGGDVKVARVEFLTLQEFDNIPKYMKGRVQYDTLTKAVEEINTALQDKYSFISRPFSSLTSMTDKKRYKLLKSQETKDTKRVYFVTADDLKCCHLLKSENNRRSLFTILRHFKRIREIRGPGNFVRIAVVPQ